MGKKPQTRATVVSKSYEFEGKNKNQNLIDYTVRTKLEKMQIVAQENPICFN